MTNTKQTKLIRVSYKFYLEVKKEAFKQDQRMIDLCDDILEDWIEKLTKYRSPNYKL